MFWPGEVVASRFRIVRFLAKGGMGELYEAEDLELHERIALKTILSRIADERSIQMFKREVHLARQVTQPNVCRIFDVFRHRPQAAAGAEGDAAEVVVLAMEFLNGETLADRLLREGRLTIAEALPLARQMASGLTAAHRAGVVHRDFKSLNVMLVKPGSPDGELRAVITDFGLAKRNSEDDRSNLSVSLNDAGEISGTPAYMSPEQVEGGAVTPATDVYAMGVVLFEMVTGARPFVADTPLKIAVKRLQEPAPSARIHVPDLDARWDAVIRRCLARQPADRFASPDEAVAALSDTSSRLTKPGGMAVPQTRTRKAIIGAVAVVALAVAVGALLRWPLKLGGGAGSVKRVAVLPFENLGSPEDDYFADGVADEIRGKLTSLRGLLVIARGSSTPYKKTTKTPQQIAEELHASYLLSATVRWDKSAGKSRVHVSPELVDVTDPQTPASKWQQPFVAALTDVFQVQSDIASRAARELGVVLGVSEEKRLAEKPTQNLAAYDAFLKGEETSNAMAANDPPSVRKALTSYEQAVALDPAFGQAWARISLANSTLFANVAPTPALAEHARQAAERAVALAPDRPEPYLAFGFYERFVRHDSDRALERFGKGLSVAPGNADLLTGTARAERASGAGMRPSSTSRRRSAAIQGRPSPCGRLEPRSSFSGAIPRRGSPGSGPRHRTHRSQHDRKQGHDVSRRGQPGRRAPGARRRARGNRARSARGLRCELLRPRVGPR